jgi:hypothetical protein
MEDPIKNKVKESGLVNINLEDFYPRGERELFDIGTLFSEEGILREKEFRARLQDVDWAKYANKYVAVDCAAEAIVPLWAFMLVASHLESHATQIVFGSLDTLEAVLSSDALRNIKPEEYKDKRVVINGCGNVPLHPSAFVEITRLLKPFVKSLMFGEACSTVPVYKKKNGS